VADPQPPRRPDTWAVTRLHNAMVIIEIADATILTDPWFVDSRAFEGKSPIGVRDLPPLTAIIGCHWVKDHWGMKQMQDYAHKDTLVYVSEDNMANQAQKVGFTNVETLVWGEVRPLTESVTLRALDEHVGRGRRSNNYALTSPQARIFFGGEVLDLEAVARCGRDHGPFDVAIGPVNGVHLLGRQLTVTAAEMLEATRLLGAPKLLPVHDEHRPFGPLLKIASSVRDLDLVPHDDIEVLELSLGERHDDSAA
jgi:L-ascorbate metabolism protein UlaG (beta-lactamase superfamily)